MTFLKVEMPKDQVLKFVKSCNIKNYYTEYSNFAYKPNTYRT